jgi:preprotein translocase subunit SecE
VAKKKVARKQPNAVQRLYRETIGELRKVTWPTRQEARNLTGIVLLVIVTMSFLLGTLDFLFTRLFGFILG